MRKLCMVALFFIACNTDSAYPSPGASGTMAASTEMTLGGRTYDILPILRGKEEFVKGNTMVVRAKEANAHLGQDDGEHLLAHQDDIPGALRGKVVFVFTNWPCPDYPDDIACVYWNGDHWVQSWRWLDYGWLGDFRVLRRKS